MSPARGNDAPAPGQAQPEPLAMPPAIPAPKDTPYAGPIRLAVDATDLVRHVMHVHETIPVAAAGDLILLYPKWIPGAHGPAGPLPLLADLVFHGGGKPVAWTRDPVDMYAFHVQVPAGVTALDCDFQFLSPVESGEGRVVMTPDTLDLEWNATALYPAGYFARDIPVEASVKLPHGWKLGSALEATGPGGSSGAGSSGGGSSGGDTVAFRTVTFNVLLDSPLMAGRYFARFDLNPGAAPPVHLDVIADKASELVVSPAQLAIHRALVSQATALFGSHHYDHYDFLLAISDEMDGEGLEHHRSSEDATDLGYFAKWDTTPGGRDLLSHEYTHSWNGKYRRPADLWAPNFNVPERDSLLWVYEGLTEYWGQVLAARSGLWTVPQARDMLALDAADEVSVAGRVWRPLEDTTNDPIFIQRRGQPWLDWQRSEDYYVEGLLIWLDADTLIRERTHGGKSLDDFARAFFGTNDGSVVTSTYGFDDVVHALNAVCPYDWAGFMTSRLDHVNSGPPLDGLSRGGYRLDYTDTPSAIEKSDDTERKRANFMFSIGLALKDKAIVGVAWNGPAWKAGLTVGDEIVAVDGASLSGGNADGLAEAITTAATTHAPIDIVVKANDRVRTVHVAYDGGLRYPHLVRVGTGDASIDAILAPRK